MSNTNSLPQHRWKQRLLDLLTVVIFIGFLFPIYWVFTMAFKKPQDIFIWPPKFFFTPTFENFRSVVFGSVKVAGAAPIDVMQALKNSLIICVCALLISLLIGIPAAYSLARYKFKGAEDIAFTFLSFRFAPELLIIIPLYRIFQSLGLFNTYTGMIWVYQLITLPMVIWILRGYFEDVPHELENSSRIDGYTWGRTFFKIALPLVKPGLFAAILLAFIFAWNNFLFGLVLTGTDKQPVTVIVQQFLTVEELRYGEMAAATVIVALPPLILALFSQKFLIRGLTMGAVKG